MPWTCPNEQCATVVAMDSTHVCPICHTQKTSWTVGERTRQLVLNTPRRLECRRGRLTPTTPGALFPHTAVSWHPTTELSVLTKERAHELMNRGELPDPHDLLCVRLRPPARSPVTQLALTIMFESRGLDERRLEFDVTPEQVGDEGWFALHVLCVRGPRGGEEVVFPLIHTIDVTEETPLGHAPTLEVSTARATPIAIRLGERPVTARWEGQARMDEAVAMVLEAPDLPDGEQVEFEVELVGHGRVGEAVATARGGEARAEWREWFHPDALAAPVELEPGQPFAEVTFRFTARGAGVEATSPPVTYSDALDLLVTLEGGGRGELAVGLPYVLVSPWGRRRGEAGLDGRVREEGLPPGGVSILIGDRYLT